MSIYQDVTELKKIFEAGAFDKSGSLFGDRPPRRYPTEPEVFKPATSAQIENRPKNPAQIDPNTVQAVYDPDDHLFIVRDKVTNELIGRYNEIEMNETFGDDWDNFIKVIDFMDSNESVNEAEPIFKPATPEQINKRPLSTKKCPKCNGQNLLVWEEGSIYTTTHYQCQECDYKWANRI